MKIGCENVRKSIRKLPLLKSPRLAVQVVRGAEELPGEHTRGARELGAAMRRERPPAGRNRVRQ